MISVRWLAPAVPLALAAVGWALPSARPQAPPVEEEPREIGLIEKATGRLAQLDISVSGPRGVIAELTAADFELVVGGRFIENLVLDRVCPVQEPSEPGPTRPADPTPADTREDAEPRRSTTATYLFYFDQHHLRPSGRQNALDTARTLIPRLITGGNRGIVVSAGEELETFAELTADPGALLDAIDRVEKDRHQWDQYPYQEDLRVQEVLKTLSEDTSRAIAMARRHQKEERYRTEKALRLFSMVLGRLADLDAPKAVVYFADTMRSNPGEHYLDFFGQSQRELDPTLQAATSAMEMDSFGAASAFDRVVAEASAHGVRLYTVQAEGLVNTSSLVHGTSRTPSTNTRRISDAQGSLVSLARETGGQAFLNGVRASRIAERIRKDMSCLYLISFDPAGLPEDRALPVLLRVKRPKVRASTRGTILLPSESSRVTSRLLAAFAAPRTETAEGPLRGVVIPTGFEDGRFRALMQVAVPGAPLPRSQWDLGFSVVSRGAVREDASSRVTVDRPGVPVVLEAEITFRPGPYEIIMVAREAQSDQIAASRIEGSWPDPDADRATIGPVAVLQPSPGAFLREGELRTSSALGKVGRDPVQTDLPTALIGLVCRDRSRRSALRVERYLIGEESVRFPSVELEPGEERCAQIRDRIPAGIMTPGEFRYEIRISEGDEALATSSHRFFAVRSEAARAVEARFDG